MSYASIPSLSLRFQISDFRGRFTRTHHGPVTAENDSPLWFLHFRPPYHPSFLTGLIPHAILVGLVATVLLLLYSRCSGDFHTVCFCAANSEIN